MVGVLENNAPGANRRRWPFVNPEEAGLTAFIDLLSAPGALKTCSAVLVHWTDFQSPRKEWEPLVDGIVKKHSEGQLALGVFTGEPFEQGLETRIRRTFTAASGVEVFWDLPRGASRDTIISRLSTWLNGLKYPTRQTADAHRPTPEANEDETAALALLLDLTFGLEERSETSSEGLTVASDGHVVPELLPPALRRAWRAFFDAVADAGSRSWRPRGVEVDLLKLKEHLLRDGPDEEVLKAFVNTWSRIESYRAALTGGTGPGFNGGRG